MGDWEEGDWLFDNGGYDGSFSLPEEEVEISSNSSSKPWWETLITGTTGLVTAIGGANPKVTTESDVKFDMNQMLTIGLGVLGLWYVMKK